MTDKKMPPPNGEAAWRQAGGTRTVMRATNGQFPTNVMRSYTPACAKPFVELNLPVAAFHQYLSILQN